MSDEPEWPREIWMREREDHDQGVVSAVLSEHATIARWEGDKERDTEFHRYVDGDIYDSAERYHKHRIEAFSYENERLREALRNSNFVETMRVAAYLRKKAEEAANIGDGFSVEAVETGDVARILQCAAEAIEKRARATLETKGT